MMSKTFSEFLNKNNIKYTNDYKKADIIFPCGYNDINSEINSLPNIYNKNKDTKNVFIIDGADEITAKNNLWSNILNYHGFEKAKKISPNTYLFNNTDLNRLNKEHENNKIYIVKKNIQRQEGIMITDNLNKINNNKNEGYVVIQELLQNPYLVNRLKINLRVYVLVMCYLDTTNIYMYDDGFMYYTKKPFLYNSIDKDVNITTGYVDRNVYIENPLTHTDFKKYLDLEDGENYYTNNKRKLNHIENKIRDKNILISEFVFNNIMELIKNVFISYKGNICKTTSQIYKNKSYQIFGADVAINENLEAQIIEINKGPDLDSKDERDGKIKLKLTNDIFEIIGLKQISKNNGFIEILSL